MPKIEHDPELVSSLAASYHGNAVLHLRAWKENQIPNELMESPPTQNAMIAASSMAIAASYWSLIDQTSAIKLYGTAAELYRTLGHSYWIALALASGRGDEIKRILSTIGAAREMDPQMIAFSTIASAILPDDQPEENEQRLQSQWKHFGNAPVGRLGIPLDTYMYCASAMRQAPSAATITFNKHEQRNSTDFAYSASTFVARATEAMRSSGQDRNRWTRLYPAILPAEPEAIAVTASLSRVCREVFDSSLRSLLQFEPEGRLMVEIGDEIQEASLGGQQYQG